MVQRITSCDETECIFVAEHFLDYFSEDGRVNNFDQVLVDISQVYDNAILVGALAASKYILPPVEPRVTFDVDLIIDDKDFEDFLEDEIPEEKRRVLDTHFMTSDSTSHSLKHRRTKVYVDFLSAESMPISGKMLRYILENREETTNNLVINGARIEILKPEILIAMKLNRFTKIPRSEKGLSDRLDVIKILKSYHGAPELMNPERIRDLLRRRELPHFEEMLEDVNCELCEPAA